MRLDELKARHRRYIASKAWKQRRASVVMRSNLACERCGATFGTAAALDVHHKTYERLGHERDTDLEVLCSSCHQVADQQRAEIGRLRADQALYDARFHGWATKRYGDEYGWSEELEDEFHEFLERQDD